MSIDLTSLLAKDTTKVEILHPGTKEPIGIRVTIAGPAADTYQAARLKLVQENMGNPDVTKIHQTMFKLLVACVLAWEGVMEHGVVVPCTPENVERILSTPGYYWLKDQLEAALGDVARFITA